MGTTPKRSRRARSRWNFGQTTSSPGRAFRSSTFGIIRLRKRKRPAVKLAYCLGEAKLRATDRMKYFITTAIDYTNGEPHIGHAYEKILADVIARYHRTFAGPTSFLTGV